MLMSPPGPLFPVPTVTKKEPPWPEVAEPVEIDTAPELLVVPVPVSRLIEPDEVKSEEPVLIDTDPLTPCPALLEVCNLMSPLL